MVNESCNYVSCVNYIRDIKRNNGLTAPPCGHNKNSPQRTCSICAQVCTTPGYIMNIF